MSKDLSVKGWLLCEFDEVSSIKNLINQFADSQTDTPFSLTLIDKYNQGWVFPEQKKGWISYIFYGFDIRAEHEEYLTWVLSKILITNNEIEGFFKIEDFDADWPSKTIDINNGELKCSYAS
jgi:hypothetical protein